MKNDACCLTPPKGIKVCAGAHWSRAFDPVTAPAGFSLLSRRAGATFIGLPLSISKPSGVTTFHGKTLSWPAPGFVDTGLS
jgi:hypothetical protein